MTTEEIATLHTRRAALRLIEIQAQEQLDYVWKETLKNDTQCDHKYPDGRWAESQENGICAICGCGMGYQHYLETQ